MVQALFSVIHSHLTSSLWRSEGTLSLTALLRTSTLWCFWTDGTTRLQKKIRQPGFSVGWLTPIIGFLNIKKDGSLCDYFCPKIHNFSCWHLVRWVKHPEAVCGLLATRRQMCSAVRSDAAVNAGETSSGSLCHKLLSQLRDVCAGDVSASNAD